MKKLIIAAATLAAVASGPALAADLGAPVYKAPVAPVPVFTWNGFYIGGNIGGKWADTSGSVDEAPSAAAGIPNGSSFPLGSTTASTFMGGGQVGYNWQTGPVVFGLEGDIDAQRWSTTLTVGTDFPPGTFNFISGDVFSVESRWQSSIRGRIGYAWDRFLLYATGGVAFTDVRADANFAAFRGAPATGATDSATLVGGTVGGGLEYAIWNNVSIGVEGRYTWYGNHTFNAGSVAFTPTLFVPVSQTIQLNTAEVLGKVNFRFWTPGY